MTASHRDNARRAHVRAAELKRARGRAGFERSVRERGGRIEGTYVDRVTKVRLRCAEGHTWTAVPGSITSGRWCPICAVATRIRMRQAAAFAALQAAVRAHRGRVLTRRWTSAKAPMRFRCARGHAWSRSASEVMSGSWCSICRATRRSIDPAHELAAARGGHCLSRSYANPATKLRWRCRLGHEWHATFDNVRQGRWCPHCRGTVRGRLETMRALARERGGECLSLAYRNADQRLRWRCAHGHAWRAKPADVVKGSWCPTCAKAIGSRPKLTLADLRATARERGGRCLAEVYVNNKRPVSWECARGHRWNASPNRVRQGSWCPTCAHRLPGTLGGMRALAADQGGRCVSRSWNDHRKPLRFVCAAGHRFSALASAVRTGVWCPRCPARAHKG